MPEVASLSHLNNSIFLIKLKQMIHNKKDSEVNIVFEYADRNLLHEMQERAKNNQPFNENEVATLMYQALAALDYMH